MTKLKIETKTIHVLESRNLSNFITKQFGHEFELEADQELSGDQDWTFSVGPEKYHQLLEWDHQDIEDYKANGRKIFMANKLLQYLYDQGIIPAGDYLVRS